MSDRILAIDPGPTHSAWALVDSLGAVEGFGKEPNGTLLNTLALLANVDHVAIEMIASYGMPVGAEVFETCVWIGRFWEVALQSGCKCAKVYRRNVKLHLCNSARAKDANVRQALIDRYGGNAKGIGTKKAPGPLYGAKADVWAALGVAVTFLDNDINGYVSADARKG